MDSRVSLLTATLEMFYKKKTLKNVSFWSTCTDTVFQFPVRCERKYSGSIRTKRCLYVQSKESKINLYALCI